jgi:hypothetical protein
VCGRKRKGIRTNNRYYTVKNDQINLIEESEGNAIAYRSPVLDIRLENATSK